MSHLLYPSCCITAKFDFYLHFFVVRTVVVGMYHLSQYFTAETSSTSNVRGSLSTSYDCYVLSYNLANPFRLDFDITGDSEIPLVETLVKGLEWQVFAFTFFLCILLLYSCILSLQY